jgi:hypothetical protein
LYYIIFTGFTYALGNNYISVLKLIVRWIDLAEDRDQWRAVVNTVMNLWVP